MDNCIICHKPIEYSQMVKTGSKPTYFFPKKGRMHASCYKIFKVFTQRGALLPVTLFLIGIVLMVLILIPGLITQDTKWIVTSIVVLALSSVISVVWYLIMYFETRKECQIREPIKKKDDLDEYDADFRMKDEDYAIQEESFDYYHENIDQSQLEDAEEQTAEKWALNLFNLETGFTRAELETQFQHLLTSYQPSQENGYATDKVNELLKAVKILQKSKK